VTRKRVLLHYLDGAISVDVFFPLRAYADAPAAEALQQRLRDALRHDPRFSEVRVYFG
jgi:hypothetical protein